MNGMCVNGCVHVLYRIAHICATFIWLSVKFYTPSVSAISFSFTSIINPDLSCGENKEGWIRAHNISSFDPFFTTCDSQHDLHHKWNVNMTKI